MYIRIVLTIFYILIISSCSSSPKELDEKISFDSKNNTFEFDQVSNLKLTENQKIYGGTFIVALPNYKEFSEFNNFFQIGVVQAIKEHGIENNIEFIIQEELVPSEIKDNFLIGPVSKDLVKKLDGSISKDKALFLNETKINFNITLDSNSQIKTLAKYLESKQINRVGIISDELSDKEAEKKFKANWFDGYRDIITIEADKQTNTDSRIKNFLDVTESNDRYAKIDDASFSFYH